VGVGVDPAGDHVLARRVDDPVDVALEVEAEQVDPGASTAAIVSPSMSTSAAAVPVAFTTVPFLMRVLISRSLSWSVPEVGWGIRGD